MFLRPNFWILAHVFRRRRIFWTFAHVFRGPWVFYALAQVLRGPKVRIPSHDFRDLGFLDLGSCFPWTKGFLGFGSCFQWTKCSGFSSCFQRPRIFGSWLMFSED